MCRAELPILLTFNKETVRNITLARRLRCRGTMKTHWTPYRYAVVAGSILILLVACTSKMTRVRHADYLPRPNLTISLIDPSAVLVHHPAGTSRFTADFGLGGQDTYLERRYQGFPRSRDVYG